MKQYVLLALGGAIAIGIAWWAGVIPRQPDSRSANHKVPNLSTPVAQGGDREAAKGGSQGETMLPVGTPGPDPVVGEGGSSRKQGQPAGKKLAGAIASPVQSPISDGKSTTEGTSRNQKWPLSLEAEGLRGESVLATEEFGLGERVEIDTVLENTRAVELLVPESILRGYSPTWALDVRFEDGYQCERRVASDEPHRRDADGVGMLRLKAGERREVRIDLASEVRMSWVGKYTCRLGLDLSNRWGRGESVYWLSPIIIQVGPASDIKLEGMLSAMDLTKEWGEYKSDQIARATDSGDLRLLEPAKALALRVEEALRGGALIPGRTEGQARLGPQKIEVLAWAQAGKWKEVAGYLRAARGGDDTKERFDKFVSVAYEKRLEPMKSEEK